MTSPDHPAGRRRGGRARRRHGGLRLYQHTIAGNTSHARDSIAQRCGGL